VQNIDSIILEIAVNPLNAAKVTVKQQMLHSLQQLKQCRA
jgi:hypothetical protein